MGTSASSKGPGSNVPLVPPWVPPLESMPSPQPPPTGDGPPEQQPPPTGDGPPEQQPLGVQQPSVQALPSLEFAPPRRFAGARASLGSFARSGSSSELKRGLGHYTRTGLGGAQRAAQRVGGTARTAGLLYGVLDALRSGQALQVDLGIDTAALAGRSAKEIGDRIIDAIRPVDGTQDAEASRNAIALAVAELINENPDADLTALSQEQVEQVTERYVARDLCHRVELDIGKAVIDKAPDPATGVKRINEIRQYVQEKLAACFRLRRERGERMTRVSTAALTGQVIRDTFEIFEEYV